MRAMAFAMTPFYLAFKEVDWYHSIYINWILFIESQTYEVDYDINYLKQCSMA